MGGGYFDSHEESRWLEMEHHIPCLAEGRVVSEETVEKNERGSPREKII